MPAPGAQGDLLQQLKTGLDKVCNEVRDQLDAVDFENPATIVLCLVVIAAYLALLTVLSGDRKDQDAYWKRLAMAGGWAVPAIVVCLILFELFRTSQSAG
jgi:hypothetical protein